MLACLLTWLTPAARAVPAATPRRPGAVTA
jgi:hypothetical protein